MIAALLVAGVAALLVPASEKTEQTCMSWKQAKDFMGNMYGEVPEGGGGMMNGEAAGLFLFRNPRTGSWSIFKNSPRLGRERRDMRVGSERGGENEMMLTVRDFVRS